MNFSFSRNKLSIMLFVLLVASFGMFAIGCGKGSGYGGGGGGNGGGGNGGGGNPPPAPTVTGISVSANPASLQLAASGNQPTSQITVKVSYSDGSSDSAASVTISPASGDGTLATNASGWIFTPSASLTAQTTVTVSATATKDATKTAATSITIIPAPSGPPPTVQITAGPSQMAFGSSGTFTIAYTGDPTSITCAVTAMGSSTPGTGACPSTITGDTFTYTLPIPQAAPTVFADTISVTVTNAAGSTTAQTNVSFAPSVTSATFEGASDPSMAVVPNPTIISLEVHVVGTGFYPSTVITANSHCGVSPGIIDATHVDIVLLCGNEHGQNYTGPFDFSFSEPSPGAASSEVHMVIAGNLNLLALGPSNGSTQEAYFLDSDPPTGNGGVLWKYKINLSDGTFAADGSCMVGEGDQSIAVDDKTGDLLLAQFEALGIAVYNSDCSLNSDGALAFGQAVLDGSAQGGYLFSSLYQAGQMISIDLTQPDATLLTMPIGNEPWETATLTVDNQLDGFVCKVGDLTCSLVPLPFPSQNPAPLWTLPVSGFTPASQIQTPPSGGWPLAVSESGATAWLLSRYDGRLALIKLTATAGQQVAVTNPDGSTTNTVAIPGHILRMTADDKDEESVIGFGQTDDESTSFKLIDTSGHTTDLTAKAPFYCMGFSVTADGQWIVCGMAQFGGGAPNFTVIKKQ